MNVDPWKRASLKGAADARAIYKVQNKPDRIGFLLSKDPALFKAVAWSKTVTVLYPGYRTYSLKGPQYVRRHSTGHVTAEFQARFGM